MIITIDRKWKKEKYTIGNVYINGQRFGDGKNWCNTLEDTDRGLNSLMSVDEILKKKVYGETAIPVGEYIITVTYSPTFKKNLPLVNAVKGFTGVRLHSGNAPKDTYGCILFGCNDKVGWVSNSRYWCKLLQDKIEYALGRKEVVKLRVI